MVDVLLSEDTSPDERLEALGAQSPGVSLEKSWHGLHYVLTGDAIEGDPPLNFLLQGGRPLGSDEDEEDGADRLLDPAAVAELNAALAGFSDDEFVRRFDPEAMENAELYPGIWDEPVEDLLEEYLGYFHQMKEYIASAAGQKHAILISLG
jgi:hypothetical protein